MVDRNAFFRQVTLGLCSHLEIEEGLRACIKVLAAYMPADTLYLEQFDHTLGAMRIVARASATTCEKMNKVIPLSASAKAAMAELGKQFRAGEMPPVLVINRPREEPVTLALLRALGDPLSSAMSLPLIVEGRPLGTLALLAEGDDRFTEDHAALYRLLKEPFYTAMSNTLKHSEVLRLKEMLADDNRYLRKELREAAGKEIVGGDFGLREVTAMAAQVSGTDSPVLLLGETGTGKDVIANAIHYGSPRRDGPFIKVNCGAIPEALIDSELFGHEKGAFSGATADKRGRFERADGGTIFLDEVGELPLQAQVRLLRVLQEKEIERVGGSRTFQVNIRVIAATNRNLPEMVAAGTFREDLWFRLNVFPIRIPPLRERRDDIPALAVHFIERKAKSMRLSTVPRIAPGAMEALLAYRWPGNVRELENIIERALILHPEGPLSFGALLSGDSVAPAMPTSSTAEPIETDLDATVARHIRRVLNATGGQIHGRGGAAELLGINPNTLRSRMKKLGIDFRHRRPA